MTLRIRTLAVLALTAGTLTACRRQPETAPVPETPPPSAPVTPPRPVTPTPVTPTTPTVDPAATARAIEAIKNTITQTIYFDYDRSELRDDARAALDAKVPYLQSNPAVRIRVEGHTDERGSEEYNQALGQRRAAAAQRYLTDRGVAASRIDVVSFGESRAVVSGEGEASWSKNRRDEFSIVAGADQIRPAAGR